MKLIALTNIKFKGERIAQDGEFDATDKEASALIEQQLARKSDGGKRGPSVAEKKAADEAKAQAQKLASDAVSAAEAALQGAQGEEAVKAAQAALDDAKTKAQELV